MKRYTFIFFGKEINDGGLYFNIRWESVDKNITDSFKKLYHKYNVFRYVKIMENNIIIYQC